MTAAFGSGAKPRLLEKVSIFVGDEELIGGRCVFWEMV